MDSNIRTRALSAVRAVEAVFDRAFGTRDNPLRHLGALGFYFFWVMAVSGIYLYAFYDTGVTDAYSSVEWLTHDQWYVGGVMRSLHRYAADAFVLVMVLHLAKETVNARYRGFRWFSWLTGLPTLWLAYASGIGGYWLVWDEVAQFSATATTEWLDWLPLFGEPLARNFLTPAAVNDRFFSLLSFLHIGIPLLLLLAMWVHIQRVSLADVAPPRRLGWGTLAALAALSVAKPAVSAAAANLVTEPAHVALDWFYLFVHPLMYQSSPAITWGLAFGATLLLAAAPLLPKPKPAPVAQVSPPDCNGCGRCVADCPFSAVRLIPHSLKGTYKLQAQVDAALCASCGICAGACPSSTPFRSAGELVSGIDMPQLPIDALRRQFNAGLVQLSGPCRTVAIGCDCAVDVNSVAGAGVLAISLPCIGNLPPAFIEYALRRGRQGDGADGVLITGCREGDCAYRFGNEWTEQRLAGEREPHLRLHVPRHRVQIAWANSGEEADLARSLGAFRARLVQETAAAFERKRPLVQRRHAMKFPTSTGADALGHPAWRNHAWWPALPRVDYALAVPQDARRRLALGWLWLGLAALIGAGVFSLLLVASRTPFVQNVFPLVDFFRVALVVHVDLSVLVWFLAFAGAFWSLNCTPGWLRLGWGALAIAAAGAVLMTVSPFAGRPVPVMSNYVPVLESRLFLAGLLVFAAGVALLTLRSLSAVPRIGARLDGAAVLRFGLNAAAVSTAVAIAAFAWSWAELPEALDGKAYYELLFWGGGHVLQFTWTLLMFVAWLWLASESGCPLPLTPRVALLLLLVALASVFLTPVIYLAYDVTSVEHHRLLTWLMRFGGGLTILPIGTAAVIALARAAPAQADERPLRVALMMSLALFAFGGLIGLTIDGSNVKVPAHYHGSIVGVTLAFMGVTYLLLPRLGFGAVPPRSATWQAWLYGVGQMLHITGLVWSGGYGVQRKVAGAEQGLDQIGKVAGMGLMGLGGLIAVIGGVMFLVIVLRALMRGSARVWTKEA